MIVLKRKTHRLPTDVIPSMQKGGNHTFKEGH